MLQIDNTGVIAMSLICDDALQQAWQQQQHKNK